MMNERAATLARDATSRSTRETAVLAPSPFPVTAHVLLALWVSCMVLLGVQAPDVYESLMQEDRFVEWWTVPLFAAAGVFALRRAIRHRRAFDALVGAFCIFVAGEEFSWGQRLLGITPPAPFLEHNYQQELTLHNFAGVFGQPGAALILALAGFGVLLPSITAIRRGRALLEHIGATAPRPVMLPWFALAAGLLAMYPLPFTGEWVEAMAGGLFLLTYAPAPRTSAAAALIGAAFALALTAWSGRGSATPAQLACAQAEAAAIANELAYGEAATARLAGARSVHKRAFTAVEEGYVRPDGLTALRAVACPEDSAASARRAYLIDPWGTAYWIATERGADSITVRVYSFGPNRRRDGGALEAGGDDIGAPLVIRP
ncbi:MAG: hypothetical protein GX539_16950 [Candidatus Cloacimonetes bacterium]|jgi:hypothetical protein|nr:hypothetical protein [Candidatus Cloacimonadota bacterium]